MYGKGLKDSVAWDYASRLIHRAFPFVDFPGGLDMSPQVLVVSHDGMLLQTRQLILGAFFQVQSAGRIREVEELLSIRHFDLIILCYTLSPGECREVIDLAAEHKSRARVLMLTPAGVSPTEPTPSEAVMTEAGPYPLLKKTAEMLGVDIRAKATLAEV